MREVGLAIDKGCLDVLRDIDDGVRSSVDGPIMVVLENREDSGRRDWIEHSDLRSGVRGLSCDRPLLDRQDRCLPPDARWCGPVRKLSNRPPKRGSGAEWE